MDHKINLLDFNLGKLSESLLLDKTLYKTIRNS